MENPDCWAIFGNPYHDNATKTEYLVNLTFSLQFFALSPQKLIIATQWMTNKHLTFLVNVLLCQSVASECFLLTNFMITSLVALVAFHPSGSMWQPSMSKGFTSIPESLKILIRVCSRFWHLKLHSKSQIFWHCYICCIAVTWIVVFQDLTFFLEGFDWHLWQSATHYQIFHKQPSRDDPHSLIV